MLFVEKIIFWWLHRRFKNLRSTTCKHRRKYYGKCDVIYRYLHIELIWRLLMVQYIQNNVIMKWTARFIRFTGWVPLKYGSTTTPSIIAHCKKTPMSSVVFHIAIPQTSNIRRTPSFDLPTVEFSKRVSIISRALYQRQDGILILSIVDLFSISIGNTRDHVAKLICLEWHTVKICLTFPSWTTLIDNVGDYLYLKESENGNFIFNVAAHQLDLRLHHFSQFHFNV